MKSGRLSKALSWLVVGLALLLLSRAFSRAELTRVWSLITSLGPGIVWVPAPYFGVLLADTMTWRSIFNVLGSRSVPFWTLFEARLGTDAVYRLVPGGPLLAEAIKPAWLSARQRIPPSETTASLAILKVLTIATHGIYLSFAAILCWSELHQLSPEALGSSGLAVLAVAGAIGLLLLALLMGLVMFHGSIATKLHQLLGRLPGRRLRAWLASKKAEFAATDQHMVQLLRAHQSLVGVSAGWQLLAWAGESVESFLVLKLLAVPLSFPQVLAFESVVSLLRSIVFFIPGSIGVQDLSYLAFIRISGVPDPTNVGVAFVLLKRGKEVLWLLPSLLLIARRKTKGLAKSGFGV